MSSPCHNIFDCLRTNYFSRCSGTASQGHPRINKPVLSPCIFIPHSSRSYPSFSFHTPVSPYHLYLLHPVTFFCSQLPAILTHQHNPLRCRVTITTASTIAGPPISDSVLKRIHGYFQSMPDPYCLEPFPSLTMFRVILHSVFILLSIPSIYSFTASNNLLLSPTAKSSTLLRHHHSCALKYTHSSLNNKALYTALSSSQQFRSPPEQKLQAYIWTNFSRSATDLLTPPFASHFHFHQSHVSSLIQ